MIIEAKNFTIDDLNYFYLQGFSCECNADRHKILVRRER